MHNKWAEYYIEERKSSYAILKSKLRHKIDDQFLPLSSFEDTLSLFTGDLKTESKIKDFIYFFTNLNRSQMILNANFQPEFDLSMIIKIINSLLDMGSLTCLDCDLKFIDCWATFSANYKLMGDLEKIRIFISLLRTYLFSASLCTLGLLSIIITNFTIDFQHLLKNDDINNIFELKNHILSQVKEDSSDDTLCWENITKILLVILKSSTNYCMETEIYLSLWEKIKKKLKYSKERGTILEAMDAFLLIRGSEVPKAGSKIIKKISVIIRDNISFERTFYYLVKIMITLLDKNMIDFEKFILEAGSFLIKKINVGLGFGSCKLKMLLLRFLEKTFEKNCTPWIWALKEEKIIYNSIEIMRINLSHSCLRSFFFNFFLKLLDNSEVLVQNELLDLGMVIFCILEKIEDTIDISIILKLINSLPGDIIKKLFENNNLYHTVLNKECISANGKLTEIRDSILDILNESEDNIC